MTAPIGLPFLPNLLEEPGATGGGGLLEFLQQQGGQQAGRPPKPDEGLEDLILGQLGKPEGGPEGPTTGQNLADIARGILLGGGLERRPRGQRGSGIERFLRSGLGTVAGIGEVREGRAAQAEQRRAQRQEDKFVADERRFQRGERRRVATEREEGLTQQRSAFDQLKRQDPDIGDFVPGVNYIGLLQSRISGEAERRRTGGRTATERARGRSNQARIMAEGLFEQGLSLEEVLEELQADPELADILTPEELRQIEQQRAAATEEGQIREAVQREITRNPELYPDEESIRELEQTIRQAFRVLAGEPDLRPGAPGAQVAPGTEAGFITVPGGAARRGPQAGTVAEPGAEPAPAAAPAEGEAPAPAATPEQLQQIGQLSEPQRRLLELRWTELTGQGVPPEEATAQALAELTARTERRAPRAGGGPGGIQ